MRMPWKNDPGIVSMIIAGFMTLLGTVASYAYRVLNGEPFRWTTLILQFFISIFAGSLMYTVTVNDVGTLNHFLCRISQRCFGLVRIQHYHLNTLPLAALF
jgi:ABC-type sugar transport system permease subunit